MEPKLKKADIYITGKCNLRCKHCFHFASPSDVSNDLSKDEWAKFFQELKVSGVDAVILGGGEPFLKSDFREIIDSLVFNKIHYDILSNGTLINKTIALKLKKSGLDMIAISIDGMKETHDNIRGKKGTFNLAIKALKILKKVNLLAAMRITLMKNNLCEIPNIIHLVIKLNLRRVLVNKVIPTGRALKNNLFINKKEYINALNQIVEIAEGKIEVASSDPITFPIFAKHNQIKKEYNTIDDVIAGCTAGVAACHITANGNVLPCAALNKIIVGNIRKQSFKDIWENSNIFEKLRDSENLKGKCGACSFKHICGGCRAFSLNCNKDLFAESPICLIK